MSEVLVPVGILRNDTVSSVVKGLLEGLNMSVLTSTVIPDQTPLQAVAETVVELATPNVDESDREMK